MNVVVAHTGQLDAALLDGAHELLRASFDDLTDSDWEHCLGGMHAVAVAEGAVVGHASLVARVLLHGDRALRTGYVEAVAVRADMRRRGVGGSVMAPLEELARSAYDIAALGATDEGASFYRSRGWQQWRGPTSALTPRGVVRTTDADDWVYVLACGVDIGVHGELTCDYRDGDVW